MVASTRTDLSSLERSAERFFDDAVLVTADQDDLAFTIETVLEGRASFVPLSVKFDGVAGSAIVWAQNARRIVADEACYWLLLARLTDVVSSTQWAAGLNSACALVVPVEVGTQLPETNCYLVELTEK
ncbi:hypothetical protein H7I53_22575 [Mycolicibacterium pulveris]|uniref:Uncharacterized protein n=1 Tax=Mycolicibacterium pulveris TaxID=36813 RepID=A0A7I7UQL8_MYCPV|nr:hypothetical protein [Mycolicibacterium pulveris]MCV6982995.1 hypothetical protein [Mycolicibacterium pulveris]BBY82859.1 hypothetical protein MPUL_40170 [Mycolicibacterium pulveris]